jgi:hypothetical protein
MSATTRVPGGVGLSQGWTDSPKLWEFVAHCRAMGDEVEIERLPNGQIDLTIAFSDRED